LDQIAEVSEFNFPRKRGEEEKRRGEERRRREEKRRGEEKRRRKKERSERRGRPSPSHLFLFLDYRLTTDHLSLSVASILLPHWEHQLY
jgi:hypothetical protein